MKSAYFPRADISIFQRIHAGRAVMDGFWSVDDGEDSECGHEGILGTIAMYFINSLLGGIGLPLGVGINAATVLTSGILGFPGLLALYGIGIYRIL